MFRLYRKDSSLNMLLISYRDLGGVGVHRVYDNTQLTTVSCAPAYSWKLTKFSTSATEKDDDKDTVTKEITPSKDTGGKEVGIRERLHYFIAWLGGYYSKRAVLFRSSGRIYENCISSLNMNNFFEAMDLPDTYQSWFLVTHLHLWLCLVRLKREGTDGDVIIKELVTMFWEDARQRMNKIGVRSTRIASRNITEYHLAFNGLLIAYEEGLVHDDIMLASVLWRNVYFKREKADLIKIANLVEYIRKQVHYMDNTHSSDILESGDLKCWTL